MKWIVPKIFRSCLCLFALTGGAALAADSPQDVFAQLDNVPVGIAATRDGRVFVSFSRAIDPNAQFSVGELKDGAVSVFPPTFKQDNGTPDPDRLLSVQALTVDANDTLWTLDSGGVGQNPVKAGSVKLIGYDVASNTVTKRIVFPRDLAGAKSFFNDVRVDLGEQPSANR